MLSVVQGELVISSQVTRSQLNNLNDAIARLQEALDQAAESVKPIESDPEKVKKLQKLEAAVRLSMSTFMILMFLSLLLVCLFYRSPWLSATVYTSSMMADTQVFLGVANVHVDVVLL